MPAIFPIASTRISDSLIQARLIAQFEFDQHELLRIQDQVSTGLRFSTPSQDAPAAIRAATLQRLIEHKQQALINLNTTASFNSATDTALSGATDLLSHVRALALGAIDSTATPDRLAAISNEIHNVLDQFMSIGNTQFRGRYLFGGSKSTSPPFEQIGRFVKYNGNETDLKNYIDVDFLSATNVNGAEAFGAISAQVQSTRDFNPIVTEQTRLSDLRNGRGISLGSIQISDGTNAKTIDLSSATTLGDVIALIEKNPPDGRKLNVTLSSNGLVIEIDSAGGGSLSVHEVEQGSTAAQLGILNKNGVGTAPLIGTDLDPVLRATTRLKDLLGSRASALVTSPGQNNDIIIEAADNGAEFNDVTIQFVHGAAIGNQAIPSYDAGTKTLTIDISPNVTQANTVIEALNASGLFTGRLDDRYDANNDGSGVISVSATGTTSGGAGQELDLDSGIQIVNGGETHTIDFTGAETLEDMLNILNKSSANVIATINATGTGINVRSRFSGGDFMIGENGGNTATHLGIRTMTDETFLSDLDYGRGIEAAEGADFIIQRRDGVSLSIDISDAETIGDVLDAINNHVDNVGARVTARLSRFGNGIEIVDSNTGGVQDLTIVRGNGYSAWKLGIIPKNQDQIVAAAPAPGEPQILTGTDSNPLEAQGIFNSLLRLADAVERGDFIEIERVVANLDENFTDVTFVRAELGAKARSLDTLRNRIEQDEIELKTALSNEMDVDLATAISELAARQANLEASLRLVAQNLQMSVFNFL